MILDLLGAVIVIGVVLASGWVGGSASERSRARYDRIGACLEAREDERAAIVKAIREVADKTKAAQANQVGEAVCVALGAVATMIESE